jgi:hypothetical protein
MKDIYFGVEYIFIFKKRVLWKTVGDSFMYRQPQNIALRIPDIFIESILQE